MKRQAGRQDRGGADVQGQDHGAYGHSICVTPTTDDYLLNGNIPMAGADCSGLMTGDTLLRRRGSRGE
ncbi:alpha/beta hydrolase [Streptomyces sp. NPDC001450]